MDRDERRELQLQVIEIAKLIAAARELLDEIDSRLEEIAGPPPTWDEFFAEDLGGPDLRIVDDAPDE